jgi:DNA polymerase-3 subunit delta
VTTYIFHGPEEFLRAEALIELRAQAGDGTGMNTTLLDGRKVTLPELINAANALPFLGEQRLTIVDGLLTRLASAKGKGAGKANKEFVEGLVMFLPTLAPSSLLVFSEEGSLDDDHPVLRAAQAHKDNVTVRLFARLGEMDLRKWLTERAKRKGGSLSPDAIEALVATGEPDLRLLDQELEKLVTYAGNRAITRADVQLLVHATRTVDVFAMVDALGQRNGRKAIEQFHALVDEGEPAPRLLFMITRQFRLLLQAKDLTEQRATMPDMMKALAAPRFVVDKMIAQARQFTLPQLEHIYWRLLETDQSIKTGQLDAVLAVDMLIAEVAARGGTA